MLSVFLLSFFLSLSLSATGTPSFVTRFLCTT
jgi:hypothetical protein